MPRPEDLIYGMGGFPEAFGQIDAYRAGNIDVPQLHGMGGQDLAALDRYAQMGQFGQQFAPDMVPNATLGSQLVSPIMGLAGAGLLGANEISKMIPGAQNLIGRLTGDPSFQESAITSRPQPIRNFLSGMGGLIEGMFPRYGR